MRYYDLTVDETLVKLGTSRDGLSSEEAAKRLAEHGPNELVEKATKSPLAMILDQFKDFMILVLIAAAVISGFIGEAGDTIAIIVIVVLNAVVGFVQEYRAERAIAALKKMAALAAIVLRDGTAVTVPARELVPGDVVILEAGAVIPADVRLIETAQLKIEEAALTGESVPVDKDAELVCDEKCTLGDRLNVAYKSTIATFGRGVGVVTATGHATEVGKIADLIQMEEGVKTPLQKRLAALGRNLAIIIVVIAAVVFLMGLLRGEKPVLMLLTAISLAVAAIPEALPALVTVSLALGARKLVKQNALIRTLPAVETLGSVTYICSDKTGTLTLNKMQVEEMYYDNVTVLAGDLAACETHASHLNAFLEALALSNDARQTEEGSVGDPTETALLDLAKNCGFVKTELAKNFPRVAEMPFDSERKLMTTIHKWRDGKYVSFTKGAVEAVLERAVSVITETGLKDIDRESLTVISERMAAEGLRVLGIGMRLWDELPADPARLNAEYELSLLGFVGIMDPPREEAKEAVAQCRKAGIHPIMITGDHPLTAKAIAKRLGILGEHEHIITGEQLAEMPLEEFEQQVENIAVYARVAPEQKLKIVRALQDRGQFVAMTGDGVNDAPALKRADIGVAMGITGTGVAKEASAMILLDDNFATIVRAVREGRQIFDNIRKFIKFIMTSNSGEIWTIFLAPFFGLPIPLLPIHILWVNLVTDGLPGLALATEPPEKDVMRRAPRHPKESIFAHGLGIDLIWIGLLIGLICLFTQAYFIKSGSGHWQTMVFTVLCLSQMGNVLATRSERDSFFSIGLFTNPQLLGAVFLTVALQLMTVYVPFLNPIFKTQPLTPAELAITLSLSAVVFAAVEIKKAFARLRSR